MFRLGNFTPPTTPTQHGGVPYYKRNNSGGTDIANSTWHAFLTDENYRNYVNWIVDRMHLEDYIVGDSHTPQYGLVGDKNNKYNYMIINSIKKNSYYVGSCCYWYDI